MTDTEWNDWATSMEARAKRLLAMVVSLVGALVITAISLIAAWRQVLDAQHASVANAQNIAETKANVIVNNSRLDAAGAPPPAPVAVAEAAHIVATEAPPVTVP